MAYNLPLRKKGVCLRKTSNMLRIKLVQIKLESWSFQGGEGKWRCGTGRRGFPLGINIYYVPHPSFPLPQLFLLQPDFPFLCHFI